MNMIAYGAIRYKYLVNHLHVFVRGKENQVISYLRTADGFNRRGNRRVGIGSLRIFSGYPVVDQQADILGWEWGLEDPFGMFRSASQELHKIIHWQQRC